MDIGIWHRSIKPHPSIFVLNAATGINWNTSHRNVWIENAQIPASWALTRDHALTGIPANDWHLSLRPGACLDIVPLDNGPYPIQQTCLIAKRGSEEPKVPTKPNCLIGKAICFN